MICLTMLISLLTQLFLGLAISKDNPPVKLVFQISQNAEIYEQSIFGEPPQLAIWLEDAQTGNIQSVYVTRRTGTGDFEGKTNVPVALPAWIMTYRKETGSKNFPTPFNPAPDAITGATTRMERIEKEIETEANRNWNYYIEVNVSGDFNAKFQNYRSNGEIDPNTNGQPSLVYKGSILSKPGTVSTPVLIGRTEQFVFTETLNPNIEEITTAKMLLNSIKVICTKGD